MIYAYARVSSTDQNLARQLEAFEHFGVDRKNVYTDKKSGKDFERKGYIRLVKKLNPGDLLVIKSIDRLGRDYDAIIAEWANVTNTLGADILVLDMPLLDTRTKANTLVGKFISDVVLQVLSFVAENERANIKTRQAEGIAIAKARGIKFGRPPREYSQEFIEIAVKYKQQSVALRDALILADTSKTNFYYHLKRLTEMGVL